MVQVEKEKHKHLHHRSELDGVEKRLVREDNGNINERQAAGVTAKGKQPLDWILT